MKKSLRLIIGIVIIVLIALGIYSSFNKTLTAPPSCPQNLPDIDCPFMGFGSGLTLTAAYNSAETDCVQEQDACAKSQNAERDSNDKICQGTGQGMSPTGCLFGSKVKRWDKCTFEKCVESTKNQICTYTR